MEVNLRRPANSAADRIGESSWQINPDPEIFLDDSFTHVKLLFPHFLPAMSHAAV